MSEKEFVEWLEKFIPDKHDDESFDYYAIQKIKEKLALVRANKKTINNTDITFTFTEDF